MTTAHPANRRRGARPPSMADFYRCDSPDLFAKCDRFYGAVRGLKALGVYQKLFRVTHSGALDNRVSVDGQRELICFDSNSYLHLHRHPRVVAAVQRALGEVGYGTPSAQMLCGTSRHLRELEEEISRFHGRQDAAVFSSGYAANVGAITALVRDRDAVIRDRFSHTSIHDACRWTGTPFGATYPHRDMAGLERTLTRLDGCCGKLIVTDGVFSMHGGIAPLPQLVDIARRHGARLMVDEAHATGVVGDTGRGSEEHFDLAGSVDVLMGTFSKAPGTVGGYVTGSRELVNYLRFYANSSMFTAALPAALCAGVREAFRVMREEPEHRARLWQNVRRLTRGLRQVGLDAPARPHSAIVPVRVGDEGLLWRFGMELFDAGVKAGIVSFPAVPKGEGIVRLTVNVRHTAEDLDRTIAIFERLGRKHGLVTNGEAPVPGRKARRPESRPAAEGVAA